jgi:hypothetical protein
MKLQALKDNWLFYTVLVGLAITTILTSMSKADKKYVDSQDAKYLNEIRIMGDSLYNTGKATNKLLKEIVEGKK